MTKSASAPSPTPPQGIKNCPNSLRPKYARKHKFGPGSVFARVFVRVFVRAFARVFVRAFVRVFVIQSEKLQSHSATEYCDTCQPVAPRRLGVVMLRHVFATRARARAHVLYSSSPDVHFHIPSFTPTFPHSLPHSFIYSTVSLIVSIVLHTRLRMSQELRTPDHDTI